MVSMQTGMRADPMVSQVKSGENYKMRSRLNQQGPIKALAWFLIASQPTLSQTWARPLEASEPLNSRQSWRLELNPAN